MANTKLKKLKELNYGHTTTLRGLIKQAFIEKVLKVPATDSPQMYVPVESLPYEMYYFAVLKDGKVADYIRVNSPLANLFTYGVTFKEYDPSKGTPELGTEL
jgi:hypothetical protein